MMDADAREVEGPGPLTSPVFRSLWIATICSNVGTWMQDAGSGWVMTSLTRQAWTIALIQVATTLPMFLLALPAGALGDIVDRRRLLIAAQLWTVVGSTLLAVATYGNLITPGLLLGITFAQACGAALSAPAFQAIVPELVSRDQLARAIALNSLGVNISRAIGPALGGLTIAVAGPAAVFALNSVSTIAVVAVVVHWRRTPATTGLPPEHFFNAVRAGIRYTRSSPALRAVLVRNIVFFLFASALLALLPVLGRIDLGLDPISYGMLLGAMGIGAVAGAFALARVRDRWSPNRIATIATLILAVSLGLLALATSALGAGAAMVAAGGAWIAMLSTLNGAAQSSAASWVKARTLSVYIVCFTGASAIGAASWGALASHIGVPRTYAIAGIGLAFSLLLARRFPIERGLGVDIAPSIGWPAPVVDQAPEPDRGPVMVMVEYRIDPARTAEFRSAMQELGKARRRDGAYSWWIFEDAAEQGRVVESFLVESWLEHLRQHERLTQGDADIQERATAFHIGSAPPTVWHLLALSEQ